MVYCQFTESQKHSSNKVYCWIIINLKIW